MKLYTFSYPVAFLIASLVFRELLSGLEGALQLGKLEAYLCLHRILLARIDYVVADFHGGARGVGSCPELTSHDCKPRISKSTESFKPSSHTLVPRDNAVHFTI